MIILGDMAVNKVRLGSPIGVSCNVLIINATTIRRL
jgi:hypothetical protein